MALIKHFKAVYFWLMAFWVTAALYLMCAWRHLRVVLTNAPRDGRSVHEIASIWGRTIIRFMPGWKVTVEGREYLPGPNQPMVIVANHESMSDIWAMYYLGIQFRWLAKEEAFRLPFVGHAMQWSYYVPVLRGNRESAAIAMRDAAERIKMGIPMFFFPEGTRSQNGNMKPFKSGAFRLARDLQVPVLPIAIHGAGELLPKHSMAPGRAHVKLKIMPPLPPPPAGSDHLDGYAANTRELISAAYQSLVTHAD